MERPTISGEPKTSYEWLQILVSFLGPGYMVAVGYFDPGNWATDLAAGSQFGYRLLFIIFASNLMAMLLQSLCVRLGVVTGNDLAQSCSHYLPRWLSLILYLLCEIAIMATDLAEVIGSAIAMNLLFGLPLAWGVVITATDVMFILLFFKAKNVRYFEFLIIILVFVTAGCLFTVTAKSMPSAKEIFLGYLPSSQIFTEPGSIYVAVGIIGATVMPHNLYLHSNIVKYRGSVEAQTPGEIHDIDYENVSSSSEQPLTRKSLLRTTLQMSYLDSIFALGFALLINSSILIIASSNFYSVGRTDVAEIQDAYELIKEMLGPVFATLFAVGLLLAGQSSTITGTMTGQIVMEGFLGARFRMKPWLRRLVTRLLAVVPALICIFVYGEKKLNDLLILSQIVLSLQLPFAVWPLIYFTSNKHIMTIKFSRDNDTDMNEAIQIQGNCWFTLDLGDSSSRLVSNEVSYHNSLLVKSASIFVGILLTVFNVILLIEVARGNT